MKTKMFFRMIMASVLMLGTSNLFAQTYVTDGEPDTASLGSKARYKETLNLHANASLNDSRIIWAFPATYTRVPDVFQADGTTQLPAADGNGAYADTEIVIVTKAVASGLQLTATERSYPLVGTGCVGNTITKLIDVVAMPTIPGYGADSSSCGAPIVALLAPVNFTGYGKYDIQLTVNAFSLAGAGIGAAQTLDLANQVNVRTKETAVLHRMTVPLATLTTAAGGAFPPAGCYFEISTTDLQDRISKKNLAYNWGAHTGEVANANPDGVAHYHFYVYPVPATQPIQHIQNN